jgi:ElaB/YqjD/DUF883 family membrane-anchored ribosome-binding protein
MTNKQVLNILYKHVLKLSSNNEEVAKERLLELIDLAEKKPKILKQSTTYSTFNYSELKTLIRKLLKEFKKQP